MIYVETIRVAPNGRIVLHSGDYSPTLFYDKPSGQKFINRFFEWAFILNLWNTPYWVTTLLATKQDGCLVWGKKTSKE